MWKLESLIQPEEDYVTAIVRTLLWAVLYEYLGGNQDRPYLCYGGITSHSKTYQSHGVSSEGDTR